MKYKIVALIFVLIVVLSIILIPMQGIPAVIMIGIDIVTGLALFTWWIIDSWKSAEDYEDYLCKQHKKEKKKLKARQRTHLRMVRKYSRMLRRSLNTGKLIW